MVNLLQRYKKVSEEKQFYLFFSAKAFLYCLHITIIGLMIKKLRPHHVDVASIYFITYDCLLETHFHFNEFEVLGIVEVVIDATESYHVLTLVSIDLVRFLVER